MTDENRKARATRKPPAPTPNVADGVNNSHTSPRAIERAERISEALDFRKQGYSFPSIAGAMGVSVSTAHDYVLAGMLAIIREPAEHVLQFEMERLDLMQAGIFATAASGDIDAIHTVLQIQARRAKLLGLDKSSEGPGWARLEGLQTPLRISFVGPDGEIEATDQGVLK